MPKLSDCGENDLMQTETRLERFSMKDFAGCGSFISWPVNLPFVIKDRWCFRSSLRKKPDLFQLLGTISKLLKPPSRRPQSLHHFSLYYLERACENQELFRLSISTSCIFLFLNCFMMKQPFGPIQYQFYCVPKIKKQANIRNAHFTQKMKRGHFWLALHLSEFIPP